MNIAEQKLAISTAEAAKMIGLSKTWMEQLRCRNEGPRWVKIGGRVLYRPKDLEAYLEAHLQQAESGPPHDP